MEKYNVHLKKKFGQNFLKDSHIPKMMVNLITNKDNSVAVEVGPGGGILTRELADNYTKVLAYEIDNSLERELNSRIGSFDNVKVLYKDFLKTNLEEDLNEYKNMKKYFISNVPYYITSPIILKLLYSNIKFDKIVMMVQKEVGERFTAAINTKNYGAISVLLQYFYDIKKEINVSKNNFIPIPKVDSLVISFTPRDNKEEVKDINKFRKLVNDAFQFKRKTIKNNLKNYDLEAIEKVLLKNNLDLNSRAEEIKVSVFCEISNII